MLSFPHFTCPVLMVPYVKNEFHLPTYADDDNLMAIVIELCGWNTFYLNHRFSLVESSVIINIY